MWFQRGEPAVQVGRALEVGWKLLVKPGRLGEHLALHHLAPGSLRADERD